MDGIFISYRRNDRPLATSLLAGCLVKHYGADQVFRDLDDIDTGEDFVERIQSALDSCSVFIEVIGPDWIRCNKTRLHCDDDPVRMEIATALARDVLVIPVLLSDATMPELDELPDSIKRLHYKNASRLRSADQDSDFAKLIERLDRVFRRKAATEGKLVPIIRNKPGGEPPSSAGDDHSRSDDNTVALFPDKSSGCETIPKFRLFTERDRKCLEFEGETILLYRANLHSDDLTISAKQHARVDFRDNKWFITDLSSNSACFIQIDQTINIDDGDLIVFGRQVFCFRDREDRKVDSLMSPKWSSTVPILNFEELSDGSIPRFILSRNREDSDRVFEGTNVLVNRASLDKTCSSISSKAHARFEYCAGQWRLTDLSSNHATFLQIHGTEPIRNGKNVIFGRNFFRFEA